MKNKYTPLAQNLKDTLSYDPRTRPVGDGLALDLVVMAGHVHSGVVVTLGADDVWRVWAVSPIWTLGEGEKLKGNCVTYTNTPRQIFVEFAGTLWDCKRHVEAIFAAGVTIASQPMTADERDETVLTR